MPLSSWNMNSAQDERTCPVRISRRLHQRIKTEAARRGMKIQELAEQAFLYWLSAAGHTSAKK